MLDYESENESYDSGPAGMCAFPFRFDYYVVHFDDSVGPVDDSTGHVLGVWCGVFFLTFIKSIGDFFPLVVFVPILVESKGSRII